jgi:acetylornithine deacetylase/succinyl-diaminopimelate desuccinylase-like protein
MTLHTHSSFFSRVTKLAGLRAVHAAFAWMHQNPKTILDWQIELSKIPGPPFGEENRSVWMADRFREAGLSAVTTDAIGNVFATLPAAALPPESTGPVVVLSAHLDTVFPLATPLDAKINGERVELPGICDNAAGVVGMLAVAHALVEARVELPAPLVFLGNVGEEGEGDLRGVRYLYEHNTLAGRIAAHVVLDGAGAEAAIVQALGSRRFQVTITGPGGHSFTDAGTPNPIAALSAALALFFETPVPDNPKTTINLGTIRGGTSVNSIPESVTASVDLRSTSPDQLVRLEVALHRAVEDAVLAANAKSKSFVKKHLRYTIQTIGNRPASFLPETSPLMAGLAAVDRHLGLRSDLRLGSTDANIPLSLGVPALSLGAGGDGGGAHTIAEWYSARDRDLGLRRILLLVLAMLDWAAEQ